MLPKAWDEMVRVMWGNKLAEKSTWRQVNLSVRRCSAQLWWWWHYFISAPQGWGRRLFMPLNLYLLPKADCEASSPGIQLISSLACGDVHACDPGAAEKLLERQSGTQGFNAGRSPCSGALCCWLNSGGCKPPEKTHECLCNHWHRRDDTPPLFSPLVFLWHRFSSVRPSGGFTISPSLRVDFYGASSKKKQFRVQVVPVWPCKQS